ncbi:preprotein translocase subunit YajC [Kribbella sp. HUAS MG21]|uniref:Preprotein translocase subunit YajC n=1 Tax=Kribbella sp. HUAS MG21 TaxID=3160966 RepID=A0AAU7T6A5_9ACTN
MQLLAVPMASSGGGGGITLLLPLILIVGMIWFMSRTQKKQRQRQAETVAALKPGTKVITTSGLVGIVEETDDDYVTLEISEGVLVQVVKAAIGRVLPDEDGADEDSATDTDDSADTAESTEPAAAASADESTTPEKVDVPDAGGDKADGKVQDKPKLPPTHTEN